VGGGLFLKEETGCSEIEGEKAGDAIKPCRSLTLL
jgi:hypothetical protein